MWLGVGGRLNLCRCLAAAWGANWGLDGGVRGAKLESWMQTQTAPPETPHGVGCCSSPRLLQLVSKFLLHAFHTPAFTLKLPAKGQDMSLLSITCPQGSLTTYNTGVKREFPASKPKAASHPKRCAQMNYRERKEKNINKPARNPIQGSKRAYPKRPWYHHPKPPIRQNASTPFHRPSLPQWIPFSFVPEMQRTIVYKIQTHLPRGKTL